MAQLGIILAAFFSVAHGAVTTIGTPTDVPQVKITCGSESMRIQVEPRGGWGEVSTYFNGMIYPRGLGRDSPCMSIYTMESGPITYNLPLNTCNTMSSTMEDGTVEFYNTIVVQPHKRLVTSQGKGFHVRCKYTTREKIIKNEMSVNTLEPTMLVGTAPMPACNMVIYQGDHVAQNVKIGEPLVLVVSIDPQPVYSLRLSHCSVTDATNSASQTLIDDNGCAIDPEIMGPFKYNEDGNSASVEFQAHKFPTSDSVYYHCNVDLCLKSDGCPPVPDCSNRVSGGVTRKKRDSEEGAPAKIEVFSGFYVKESSDLTRPDIFDIVAKERALNNENSVCISQRSFAIGIAVAGLVLMLLVIAAFVILLARKRPRKDISSGSSIYSGPYTNTAYSHSS